MRKFKISISFVFCLVLLGFVGNVYGQIDTVMPNRLINQNPYKLKINLDYNPDINNNLNKSYYYSNTHQSRPTNFGIGSGFIYFFNDSIVAGNKIKLKTPFLSRNKFIVDGKVYFANKVKFYTVDGVFNANMKKEGRAPRFIKREFCGKINYYKHEYDTPGYQSSGHFSPGYYSGGYYHPGSYSPGMYIPPQHVLIQYYNFGYGDIRKATYKNLLKDIGQNPKSKYYLDKYKRKNRTENIIGIAGTGLSIMSFFFIESNPAIGGISLLSGITLLIVDLFLIPAHYKEQHLEEAIRAYN